VVVFFGVWRVGRLFCGFKILAILQILLPFFFVEFTLEKNKKKRKFTKQFKVFLCHQKAKICHQKNNALFNNTIVAQKIK
jgi:hypothetical protein